MYKVSKYNMYKQVKDHYVVYNAYAGQCKIISKKTYDDLCHNLCDSVAPDLKDQLSDKGFLVPDYVDEYDNMKALRENFIINPTTLSLYILPTEQCNFRCRYCYENFPNLKMSKKTQDGIINYVSKNIKKYKVLYVEWFGGEPLLAIDVIEYISNALIEICRKNGVIYRAAMTTNAYLLDLDCYNRLRHCRILSYQITVDGIKETHDEQRVLANGKGTYDRIINNLVQIQKNTISISLDMTIRVNISKSVYDCIFKFIDNFKSLFDGDRRFRLCFKIVQDYGGDAIQDFKDELCNKIDIRKLHSYCKTMDVPFEESSVPCIGYGVCYASKNSSWVIGSVGNLMKCTILLYDERNQVGKILDDGTLIIDEECYSKWVDSCDTHMNSSECAYSPICLKSFCYKHYLEDKAIYCQAIYNCVDDYINRFVEENGDEHFE